jgi:signal transduction histidine kinase
MRVLIIEDVKAIALMHGGDVFVRSDHGMNTFGIHLPVCPNQALCG